MRLVWEMVELSNNLKDYCERLRQLLADGWEPFAVTRGGITDPVIYSFKRQRTEPASKPERETT